MKNVITYLKALWRRGLGSQRKKIGVTLGEATIEHPFSTYSAPFGTCWQPSGKLHSVVRCAAMLVMLFTIGSGNVWGAADYIIPKLYLTAKNTPSGNTGWTFTSATANNAGTDYWKMVSSSSVVTSPAFDISGYTNVTVSIKWGSFGSFNKTKCNATVKISTAAGTWTTLGKTGLTRASTSGTVYNFSNVEESSSYSSAQIQISTPSADGSIGGRLYYVEIKGEAAGSCDASPTVGNADYNGALVYSSTPMTVPITCPSIGAGSSCEIKDYGFVWKAGGNPSISDNKTQIDTDNHSTAFSGNISGTFAAGTTYYVKAYAINNGDNTTLSTGTYSFTPRSITFNSNGGSSVSTILVISGKAASQPEDPTKDGYIFGGWYTDSGLGTAVNWSSTITSNKTYYAKWIAEPTITISETSRAFGDRKVNGGPYTMTFNVSGANLTNNISLSISGTNAGMFSVTPSSLTQSAGSVSSTEITVSYSPTSAGSHSATINITSSGATSKTVALSGTGKWEVTWSNNGATSTTLVENSTKPTFPSTPSSCDATSTTFIGWATAEWDGKIASLAGKTVHTSNSTMSNITANGTTFYAVFARGTAGSDWELVTSLSAIKEGDAYLGSYHSYSGTRYYGATSNSATQNVTVSGSPLKLSSTTGLKKVSVVATGNTNQYYIKDGTNYLYANSTGSAPTWSASTCAWTFSGPDANYLFTALSSLGTYYWRAYASSTTAGAFKMYGTTTNSGICLFQQSIAYSDYLTTCCTPLGSINGSVSWSSGEATVSWDAAGGCSSWGLQYKRHADSDIPANWAIYAGSFGTANSRTSNSTAISGLTAGTEYDFKISGTSDGSVYCSGAVGQTVSSTVPKILASSSMTDLGYKQGETPVAQTFTITGTQLTGDLTVDAPANFLVSLDGENWSAVDGTKTVTVTTPPSNLGTTTIYVKANSGLSQGAHPTGNIVISGGGATSVNVAVEATITEACTAPNHVDISGVYRYTPGETISLTAAAYSSAGTNNPITSGITYKWQKYENSDWVDLVNGLDAVDGGTFSGVTAANLQISGCTKANGGQYRCVVYTGATCFTPSAGYNVRVWTLEGNYSGYSFTANNITWTGANTGTVTLALNANSTYAFKVYGNGDSKYFGCNTGISKDASSWRFDTGTGNCALSTGTYSAGNYTFTIDITHADDNYINVSVAYPTKTTYLELCSDWKAANAKYAIYYWKSTDNGWTDFMSTSDCNSDVRYAEVPVWATDAFFVRFDPAKASTGDFTDEWNRSGDNESTLPTDGKDYYHSLSVGGNGKYYGTWGTFSTSFSITFDDNGSDGGTAMTNVTGIDCNDPVTLVANTWTKTGCTFTGWKTNTAVTINSGTAVAVNGIIPDGATIDAVNANITLEARWVLTPVITVSETSFNMGIIKVNDISTRTFTVSGSNLTSDITLAIATADADYVYYSIDETTLTPTTGSVAATTITITYAPTTSGVHNVNNLIVISATGAETKYVSVSAGAHYAHSYIDNIWNTVIADKTGTYTRPSILDQDPGANTDCKHLHYHFVGWITKAKYDAGTTIDTRTAPTGDIQATGSVTVSSSNETFYAVWAKEDAGGGSADVYTLVEETLSDWSGNYILVNAPDNDHAMSNSLNSGKFGSKEVTPSNKQITSTDGDIIWVVTKGTGENASKYSVYNANVSKYANNGSSSTSASLSTDAVYLTFTRDEDYNDVSIIGSGSRWFSYYNSNSDFRTYNSNNYGVYLYRNVGITYIDYIASCGAEYTITIDKNNASAACSSCGAKVNANAVTLSNLVAPTWTGHQVDYYMIASADNSTKIAEADGSLAASVTDWTDGDGKWIKGSDATIYAKWKYAEYEIAYYDQGGSAFSGVHGADHPTIHTYNTATALVNPTKNGYNFAGWYTSSDCSTGLVTSLGATAYTSGPINLYAKWTLKTYDVTWVVNGSTVATQTSVTYGTAYEDLSSTPSDPADNALSSCGSDRFVGWVTDEYTAEGGTKVSQYDPYAVTNSTTIDDTHYTFYAMFAKESGTAFTLDGANGSTQELRIYATVNGENYYATGDVNGSGKLERLRPDDVGTPSTYVFTKTGTGTYSIKLKGSSKYIAYDSGTDLEKVNDPYIWTITTSNHGSWRITSGTSGRALIYQHSIAFGGYATSNITTTPGTYWDVELGSSNLTNYRTGCCSEKITLTVNDATSGAGGTVAMKWNNASKSSGDQVSTCSTGTLVVDVTANPSYTLTAITIAGTNKTITLDPDDLITGLPSTSKMSYTVTVPALATGTLTITPTFTRTYSVTYNLDGGETAGSTAVVNYQSGATVTLVTSDPTKSGYDFTGWTVTKDGGGNVSVSAGQFTMPTDNVTVTAGWSAKTLSSISVTPTTAEVYVGQYVQIPVTYNPADILTKGYTLVSTPGYCVTTGSTNTTLKITGGRGGVTITSTQVETVSIKATADNTKTASVTVTVKPLPVDHFVDLVHGETFADQAATIVDNNLSTAYTAPGHADVDAPLEGNDCEKQHLHLVGWIESEWANAHLTATMSEITSAEDNEYNPLFFEVYAPMNVSGRTYYAVWGKEVTP